MCRSRSLQKYILLDKLLRKIYYGNKEMGFHRTVYYSSGLLVSFLIEVMSWRYLLPSSACFTSKIAVNTLYLSIRLVVSLYTGIPNLMSYLYHPCLASFRCLTSLFSSQRGFLAIWISSGIPCETDAFAFRLAPFKASLLFDPVYSDGKSEPI